MKLIRGLILSSEPRHLRDLAAQNSLSPAGVSDMLRRLSKAGVLIESWRSNRRCFSLELSASERACLELFFRNYNNSLLERRSRRFSRLARKRFEWMDEAFVFYRRVKRDSL